MEEDKGIFDMSGMTTASFLHIEKRCEEMEEESEKARKLAVPKLLLNDATMNDSQRDVSSLQASSGYSSTFCGSINSSRDMFITRRKRPSPAVMCFKTPSPLKNAWQSAKEYSMEAKSLHDESPCSYQTSTSFMFDEMIDPKLISTPCKSVSSIADDEEPERKEEEEEEKDDLNSTLDFINSILGDKANEPVNNERAKIMHKMALEIVEKEKEEKNRRKQSEANALNRDLIECSNKISCVLSFDDGKRTPRDAKKEEEAQDRHSRLKRTISVDEVLFVNKLGRRNDNADGADVHFYDMQSQPVAQPHTTQTHRTRPKRTISVDEGLLLNSSIGSTTFSEDQLNRIKDPLSAFIREMEFEKEKKKQQELERRKRRSSSNRHISYTTPVDKMDQLNEEI